jgi:Domain of unknown function (DUF1707)
LVKDNIMRTDYGQFWGRPYSDQNMRVSDAERQAVTDRLAQHFTDGRLDQAEFDERVSRAMAAKTRADLAGLFDDLPESDLPGTGAPAAGSWAAGSSAAGSSAAGSWAAGPFARRRRSHPVLLLVLAFVLAVTVGHALFWVTMPLLWIAFGVVAILFATGHFRR